MSVATLRRQKPHAPDAPTRVFEGQDLESTLAKVTSEIGTGGRILRAEKVRTNGVAGFFAKEWVEVEVEVTPPAVEPDTLADPPATSGAGPRSLLDLADLVSDVEHEIGAAAEVPANPTLSTESASFAAVFDRIRSQAGDDRIRAHGGDAGTHAADLGWITSSSPLPAAVASAYDLSAPPALSGPPPGRTALTDGRVWPTPTPFDERTGPPTASMGDLIFATRPERTGPPDGTPRRLDVLGLPEALRAAAGAPDRPEFRASLVRALGELPPPPPLPRSRGTVLAVVGPRSESRPIVEQLSMALGISVEDLVTVVAPHRVAGSDGLTLTRIDEVTDHRRSWRWRPQPTLVVVDAPNHQAAIWGQGMLERLEPTIAVGVADASRKVEDVAVWSAGLGGLDALALTRLGATVSPAAMLHLGIPVVFLDGQPATPARWADILLARLSA